MEEDKDAWLEEQPGAGWQEFLQVTKLPSTAPAAKLLSILLKDAPPFNLVKTQKMRGKIPAGSRHPSSSEIRTR